MNNDIDLNIDNYNLTELFKLFNLPYDFTEQDLKNAKKIVLRTHPDKCNLPKEYFLFFSKAYKLVYKVYEFKHKKSQMLAENIVIATKEYNKQDNKDKKDSAEQKMVDKLSKEKNFNQKFNELFLKNYINLDDDIGYGGWLKTDTDISDEEALKNGKDNFQKFKKRSKELAIYNEPEGLYSNIGTSLDSSTSYGGSDLRAVYDTECVLGVDENDFKDDRPKSLDEIKRLRGTGFKPLSEKEAIRKISNNEKNSEIRATQRAAKLVEQEERYKKQNNNFWSNLMQLRN